MSLPQGVKAEDIKASFSNRLLQLTIPTPEESAPKEVKCHVKHAQSNLPGQKRPELTTSDPTPGRLDIMSTSCQRLSRAAVWKRQPPSGRLRHHSRHGCRLPARIPRQHAWRGRSTRGDRPDGLPR